MITFGCEGETLLGTLDDAPGRTGLLIVSGGNEIRIGAHRGMAMLAQDVAAAGYPVFRFDRRGIGDSSGVNGGFESSGPDIAAAAACFRARQPQIDRLIAFGNCDAATALILFGREANVDRMLLANPWIGGDSGPEAIPPAAAIRARYAARMRDPHQWLRLLRGGVNMSRLIQGVARIVASRREPAQPLFTQCVNSLRALGSDAALLLASGDNTAIAFTDAWTRAPTALRSAIACQRCDTASHSFAHEADKAWLYERILETMRD
nr:hydrolase 1, exosortase A system-associated [Stakelama flava]